jgi:outer membrane immunogenic protein
VNDAALASPLKRFGTNDKRSKQNLESTTMKKYLLATVALVALAAPAAAADLAARPYTKAPPMIAALYDWSGFYLGINGGWGSSHKCWDLAPFTIVGGPVIPGGPEGCHDATGGTVGGQIGYRWQSAAWVFGIEAQGNWADFRGSNVSNFFVLAPGDVTNRSKIDSFGLFTGQIGYSWNTFLLYVKGGAAVTHDKYNGQTTLGAITFDQASETRWGGVVGVGGEYAFSPNWSAAIEYDHMFMGTKDLNFTSVVAPVGVFSRGDRIKQDVDLLTVRVNYRWGGPVVAKY